MGWTDCAILEMVEGGNAPRAVLKFWKFGLWKRNLAKGLGELHKGGGAEDRGQNVSHRVTRTGDTVRRPENKPLKYGEQRNNKQ